MIFICFVFVIKMSFSAGVPTHTHTHTHTRLAYGGALIERFMCVCVYQVFSQPLFCSLDLFILFPTKTFNELWSNLRKDLNTARRKDYSRQFFSYGFHIYYGNGLETVWTSNWSSNVHFLICICIKMMNVEAGRKEKLTSTSRIKLAVANWSKSQQIHECLLETAVRRGHALRCFSCVLPHWWSELPNLIQSAESLSVFSAGATCSRNHFDLCLCPNLRTPFVTPYFLPLPLPALQANAAQ